MSSASAKAKVNQVLQRVNNLPVNELDLMRPVLIQKFGESTPDTLNGLDVNCWETPYGIQFLEYDSKFMYRYTDDSHILQDTHRTGFILFEYLRDFLYEAEKNSNILHEKPECVLALEAMTGCTAYLENNNLCTWKLGNRTIEGYEVKYCPFRTKKKVYLYTKLGHNPVFKIDDIETLLRKTLTDLNYIKPAGLVIFASE